MRKAVVTTSLIAFIIITFSFIILRFSANGSEDNFFNQNFRAKFASSPILRQAFGLNWDGDARSDYLGNRYSKIIIEVDEMKGLEVPARAMDLLTQKISSSTGKEVSYFISDKDIPYEDSVSYEKMDNITEQYRDFKGTDTAVLYFLYLSNLSGQTDQVGSTIAADGIALFANTLEDFTKKNPEIFNNYVESTALHEFGHQLGLDHDNFSDCLMQAYADLGYYGIQTPEGVITDFCNYEKDLIQKISH